MLGKSGEGFIRRCVLKKNSRISPRGYIILGAKQSNSISEYLKTAHIELVKFEEW